MQFSGRKEERFAHPAVGVDADHLHFRAAIGPVAAAGDAGLAVHVGFDGAAIADFEIQVRGIGARAARISTTQFVAEDTGVGEEGLFAAEGVISVPHTPTR